MTFDELQRIFFSHGLEYLGAVEAKPDTHKKEAYGEWLGKNYHGSMQYLEKHYAGKYQPGLMVPDCRTILFAGLNYYQKEARPVSVQEGRIACFAWGRDYHKILRKKLKGAMEQLKCLFPHESFRSFSDATPLDECFYSEKTGTGHIGRHTLLIHPTYGSWIVLGEILTTLPLEIENRCSDNRVVGCPEGCRCCVEACPTGALGSDGIINACRCISYLTIEHNGIIPLDLRPKIGSWLFGCDLCQEACPFNLSTPATLEPGFMQWISGSRQVLSTLLNIRTNTEFAERFAGSPLMRIGRVRLIRNACIAAANNGASELLPILRQMAAGEAPLVSEHAGWAVDELSCRSYFLKCGK